MPEKLFRNALREALDEEMARDDDIFLIGEDIGVFGGAYRVTEGLIDKYGARRVVDAPISEEVIAGCAIGAAMSGLRPVVEMMTINFSLLAYDQIVNNAAKVRYMFGGKVSVPLVIRLPGGAGHQLSSQHSHSFEVLYGLIPGLIVAAPTSPEDGKGLLKSAIRTNNPVMFLESMSLYNLRGEVPDGDYTTPLGKAAVRRRGSDLTIIGVSRQSVLATLAGQKLEEEDLDAEVIDLRSIRPIDWETITESVDRTSRCLVVEEGWPTYGVGAEIAAGIQERCFDHLDAPVRRLGGAEVPMPYNKGLEKASIPAVDDIVRHALVTVGKQSAAV
ncbi:MAG: alpha-ketoacid dehydrogenase subunit beta [Candidatus Dormibacter sp.]|uniref:alpha-ketoacid dehydrogenase subunit beta n=1 Tax=Candidatus Dormibacter sp. TaxID=2973982 RepID=UPI000DB5C272|nr:MAG: alpha-ketoacid dehydrogenase subunit beta [Candidatus Dormibacteraeota bacterium]